jgi:hypothetical protein
MGDDFAEVHRWLDDCFRQFGPYHRHVRHHQEGIFEAVSVFGECARNAAAIHILRDCRHIPGRQEYKSGLVDALGLKRNWSTAAYIRYGDKEFEDLVREHLKPTALLLWAFLGWDDVVNILSSASHLGEDEILAMEPAWKRARAHLTESTHDSASPSVFTHLDATTDSGFEVGTYLREVFETAKVGVPDPFNAEMQIGYISVSALSEPFVYIDYELLEDLKPELQGASPLEVAEFAIPKRVAAPMTLVGDPAQRSVTFISRQKTIAVSPVRIRQTPEGTEVSYVVGASASAIVVGKFGDQYLLKNGIHRAYLLAQLGIDPIPCVLLDEGNKTPFLSSTYPTFTPPILVQTRKPMLSDFFKPELCLQVPIRKTNRIIRISADSTNIPVE